VIGALSKLLRIDAHCAGYALVASRTISAAMQIDDQDLCARIKLLFELFWGDPRHSTLTRKAMPSNKLPADEHRE
jgi:hypothetical protein